MRNTTNTTATTVFYGGCHHDVSGAGSLASELASWIAADMPDSPLFTLQWTDEDFGGWTICLYIRMPDGSMFVTE